MASRLSWLATCKLSQLKAIANATGINSSGTKPILTTRLTDELPQSKFSLPPKERKDGGRQKEEKEEHSVLSIDMGIRNLAYCRLIFAPNTSKPTITHWTRIAISRKRPATSSEIPEAFDPQTYATHAHTLVTRTLLPLHPSLILIERQRFRSMGGSSVQEWTLRVNMLEAMLYAVLKTVTEQGLWRGDVYPVAPAKVAKFWVGDAETEVEVEEKIDVKGKAKPKGKSTKSKSAKTKTAKVDLVSQWLSDGDMLDFKGEASTMAKAYKAKLSKGKNATTKNTPVLTLKGEIKEIQEELPLGKLDDLADCLLQAMAWGQWERNRRRVVEEGWGGVG